MSKITARSRHGANLILLVATLIAAGGVSAAPVSREADAEARVAERDGSAPAYAKLSAPRYPKIAWLAAQEGLVTLRVDVDSDGSARAVRVHSASAPRDLARAAVESVRGWRFAPARRNGVAVASSVLVPIEFAMQRASATARRADGDAGRRYAKS